MNKILIILATSLIACSLSTTTNIKDNSVNISATTILSSSTSTSKTTNLPFVFQNEVFPGLAIDYSKNLEVDSMPGQVALRVYDSQNKMNTIYFLTRRLDKEGYIYFGECPDLESYRIVKTTKTKNLLIHEIDYPCESKKHPTYVIEREYNGQKELIVVLLHKTNDTKYLESYLLTLHSVE
jgi:hypothetical protein